MVANKQKYNEGAYLLNYMPYLSIICQNWLMLTLDEQVKEEFGDNLCLLVTMPYVPHHWRE